MRGSAVWQRIGLITRGSLVQIQSPLQSKFNQREAHMKAVINNTDGFKTIVELREVVHPQGYVQVRFLTEWDNARRDIGEHVQYEMLLSPAQLKNLKDIL